MVIEKRDIRRLEKLINKLKDHIDVNDPVLVGGRKLLMKLKTGHVDTIYSREELEEAIIEQIKEIY